MQSSGGGGEERSPGRLTEICDLLRRLSGTDFRLEPSSFPPDTPGESRRFRLTDCPEDTRSDALGELLDHLLERESEMDSLCSEILTRYEETSLVRRLASRLSGVIDETEVARVVVEEAVRVSDSRSGDLWLCDGKAARLVASTPDARTAAGPLREQGPMIALEEGRPWIQEAGSRGESLLAVPLPGDGPKVPGVLVLRGRPAGGRYGPCETGSAIAIASLASVFLRNHRLARDAWDRASAERRQELVDGLTRQVHPGRLASSAGLDLSAGYRAGARFGADGYDVVPTPDGGLWIAVADVSGDGIAGAMHMATAHGVIQAEARAGDSPAALLRRLNQILSPGLARSDQFATAFVARVEGGGRRVTFANGGFQPPVLIRHEGHVEYLDPGGPALGVLDVLDYEERALDLQREDLVLLLSDGYLDAVGKFADGAALARVTEIARARSGEPATSVRDALLDELDRQEGEGLPHDDALVLVVRVC